VTAARQALETSDADLILPFVHADGAAEVRDVLDRTLKARALGPAAQEVADRWLFETAVRVRRAGEGASFTGLKPAGLDVGPVIPAAERALESGSPDELIEMLCVSVRDQVTRRHHHAMGLKTHAGEGVDEARDYVDAMLGLQVRAHSVYKQVLADPHAHSSRHDHA
jgi:hypothetical protein